MFGLAVLALLAATPTASATWAQRGSIDGPASNGRLLQPQGMVLDSGGNFLIADTLNNRIKRFTSTGTYVSAFGTRGTGDGQFVHPTDVAVTSSGDILVVDSYNHRIQRFNSSGVYQSKFGSAGVGDGQFNLPVGIAVDAANNIFVTDGNNRVQKFNSAGTYLAKVGTFGTGAGQFTSPRGIGVKPSDQSVYVADFGNHRVQKFTNALAYVGSTGSFGSAAGQFQGPSDIEFDNVNSMYVTDFGNGRVQKYDSSDIWVGYGGGWGARPGRTIQPAAVEVDATGDIHLLDMALDSVSRFDGYAVFEDRWGSTGSTDAPFMIQTAVAPDGTIYSTDGANSRVVRRNTSGTIIDSWGSFGSANGQFSTPYGIAVDSAGNVFVADMENNRIQEFTASGTHVASFGTLGTGNGQFNWPRGITIDGSDNLYVADSNNSRIQKFNSSNAFQWSFGTAGTGNGQFNSPTDVAVSSTGADIYVNDFGNSRVQRLSSAPAYVNKFGTAGTGPGQFQVMHGITLTPSGDVLVADGSNQNVSRFTGAGVYVDNFGGAVFDLEPTGMLGVFDVTATRDTAHPRYIVTENNNDRLSFWADNSAPNAPSSLAQSTIGDVAIAAGAWHTATSAKFTFTVSDPDAMQVVIPWIEIRPIGTPLSATCGSSVPGVTFAGGAVLASTAAANYATSVTVTGLTTNTQYHWRACAVDAWSGVGAWTSMGGSDGTRDIGIDATNPGAPTLNDGAGADIDSQASTTVLAANWSGATDTGGTGVLDYDWCFTLHAENNCGVAGRVAQGLAQVSTTASASSLTLTPGLTYYLCLRTRDAAGNVTAYGCTDGVLVTPVANTLTGVAFRDEIGSMPWAGCDGVAQSIKASINGAAPIATTCDTTTGAFTFTGVTKPGAGQVVVVWMSATDGEGATYTTMAAGGSSITDVRVVQDRVSLDSESPTATLTRSTLQTWDFMDDIDVPVNATAGSTISIPSSMELHVTAGITFAPGSHVSTGSLHTVSGATYDATGWGSQDLTLTGTGTADDCTLGPTVSAPVCESPGGTVNLHDGAKAIFSPAATGKDVAVSTDAAYYGLTLSSGRTFNLGTRAGQTLHVAGPFDAFGTVRTDPWHPDLSIGWGGAYSPGSLRGTQQFDMTVEGSWSGDADINVPEADLVMQGLSSYQALGNPWNGQSNYGSITFESGHNNWIHGTAGAYTYDSGGVDTPEAMAHDGDEYTFVALTRPNGGTGQDWAIQKVQRGTGTLATSFGTGGEVVLPVAGADSATSIALQWNSVVYVGGSVGGSWAVKAFDAWSGAPVNSFGTSGVWSPGITGSVTAMTLSPDGSTVFVAGNDTSGAKTTWQVRQLSTSGAVLKSMSWDGDNGSGTNTATITAICANEQWFASPDLLVVGRVGGAGSGDWALGRIIENGAGNWGWAASSFLGQSGRPARYVTGGTEDTATTCKASGGVFYVGGTEGDGSTGDVGKLRGFVREDGSAHYTFGTSGTVTINGPGQDRVGGIHVIDRRVFVTGSDGGGSGGRATMRAYDNDGEQNMALANGTGVSVWDPTAGLDRGVGVTFINNYMQLLTSKNSGADAALVLFNASGDLMDTWTGGRSFFSVGGSGGNNIHVNGDVTIGSSNATRKTLVDMKAAEGSMTIDGALRILSDGELRAPDMRPVKVGGDLAIAGKLYHEGGTIKLEPRTNQTTVNVAPSTTFGDFTIDSARASGEILMDAIDDLEVTGAFTARGRSCADTLKIRPNGATWTLTNSGTIAAATYLDIANTTFSPGRTVTNSWNAGGNSGVTFSTSCGSAGAPQAPDTFRTNGIEHTTDVIDSPAPVLSWTNRAGAAVNLADAEVLSSSPAGLVALYRFDTGAEMTDSSGNGYTLTARAGTSTTGKFGAGLGMSTAPDGPWAASIGSIPEFSVDGWFKRGPLTGLDDAYPAIAQRTTGSPYRENFWIGFDRDANEIGVDISTDNGINFIFAATTATPYTDNQWHHIAVTYSDTSLKLYLDGHIVRTVNTWLPPDTGAWTVELGNFLNGSLDDVAIRNVEMTPGEILGYYRTKRRHLDTVWSATNAALTSTADDASASIAYGGTAGSLGLDGARWYTRARFKTAATPTTWSAWSRPDWFETTLAEQTTVSLPDGAGVDFGALTPNSDYHSEFRVRVNSTSQQGWSMFATGESDSYAMSRGLSSAANQISRRTTASWPAGTPGFAGLTVLSAPGGKQSPWCGDAVATNYAGQCYTWPSASTPTLVHNRSVYDLSTQDVQFSTRINVAPTQRAGSYSGRLEFIVVPNP